MRNLWLWIAAGVVLYFATRPRREPLSRGDLDAISRAAGAERMDSRRDDVSWIPGGGSWEQGGPGIRDGLADALRGGK